jgi:hypothetical protein
VTAALGVTGILLGILGFYADKAQAFPRIERILSPDCYGEQAGLAFLITHESIDAANPNFADLARLIESKIAAANPSIPRSRIKLQSVRVTTGAINFGGGVAPTLTSRIEMQFAGVAKPVEDTLAPYQKTADGLCDSSNLKWSTWTFWIGAVLTLASKLRRRSMIGSTLRAGIANRTRFMMSLPRVALTTGVAMSDISVALSLIGRLIGALVPAAIRRGMRKHRAVRELEQLRQVEECALIYVSDPRHGRLKRASAPLP